MPSTDQLTDSAHAKLFQTPFLRVTHLEDFKASVVERLLTEKLRKESRARAQSLRPPTAKAGKRWVFLDDFASDPGFSEQLRTTIRAQGCEVRRLPPNAPLGNNGIDVRELLRPCLAGITVYTDSTKYAAVYNRLVFFLNQVADGGLPLVSWGVLLRQGTVASEFGIESEDVVGIEERDLGTFLKKL